VIVATAGHVDHGKTSLVRALTGIDTDRLPEEKRRGMTIDLGFAYRGRMGFVDVPGHERFLHNMLCGVAGIDYVLFVVAADDGPMPQTREHLAILQLLGVGRGAVALTKIDRVPRERVLEAAAEIHALLASSPLAGSPVFPVSSTTGEGLSPLLAELERAQRSTAGRKRDGNFRLSVDRCFTIAGAGLVVTGTAMSGQLSAGDEIEILLMGAKARVRALHAQNAPAQCGGAGERLALNLAGLEAKTRVARGDWIVRGAVPAPVRRFDARLRLIEPVKHWASVHVHLGAADVLGRVALLDERGLAQLVLEQPLGALHGDRFILRDASARRTVGGGSVIDVFPPPRGRAKPARLAQLAAIEAAPHEEALDALLQISPLGVDLARFAANRNLAAATGWRFAPQHWEALREHALAKLGEWHARSPQSAGLAEERLVKGIARDTVAKLIDELVREGLVVRDALGVRLAAHRVELAPADLALWKKLEPQLAALRPPPLAELAAAGGVEPKKLEAMLSRAARQGLVVRVSKNRFYLPSSLKDLQKIAEELAQRDRGLTAAAFRDRAGIGRNLAIEVLEYFDRTKFTRRVGDAHIIRAEGRAP
jgi:selenocysteine-specific elongation factor